MWKKGKFRENRISRNKRRKSILLQYQLQIKHLWMNRVLSFFLINLQPILFTEIQFQKRNQKLMRCQVKKMRRMIGYFSRCTMLMELQKINDSHMKTNFFNSVTYFLFLTTAKLKCLLAIVIFNKYIFTLWGLVFLKITFSFQNNQMFDFEMLVHQKYKHEIFITRNLKIKLA